MSNPRLMAEDVAHHYVTKINVQYPHSKNIRRHLRTPLLAVTRRILLPRLNYAELQQSEVGTFGIDSHIDPTFVKGKEGLDWRDYVSSKSLTTDRKSDTEISDSSDDTQQPRLMQYYGKRQPQGEMKLSRRSLARMEAFVASCALALPDDLILPFVPSSRRIANGGKLNNNTSKKKPPPIFAGLQTFATSLRGTTEQKSNNVDTATSIRNDDKYPQMNVNDLTLRLELYIRNLRRIYAVREQQLQQQQEEQIRQGNHKELIECVVNFEPPRTIRARIQILLNSLIATTNSVGSMRPILTNLLKNLTRELLAVECLSEELNGYIRKIVLEYEHLTSFASLAFLSSPGDSAETHLSPLLLNYLEYLRTEWELCVDKCKLESTLARAIHPGMRKVFKSSEFTSIGHLLEVCQGYKDQLENVVILPRDSINWGDGSVIDSSVDGSLSPPDVISSAASGDTPDLKKISSSTTKAIKQALRDLRREIITVNGHLLPPAQSLTELVKLLRERLHSRTVKLKDRKIAQVKKRQGNDSSDSNSPSTSDSGTSYNTDNDIVSSGNEGDTDGSTPRNCRSNNKNSPENSFFDSDQKQEGIAGKVKRRHFNVDAIDIMTRRLLVAASRTSSGGDAFFVVRDLFGGEGVEVIPSTVSPMGPYIHGRVSSTIELTVRLASLVIKCHSTFNVYPEPYTGECEALIQLHTTTTERIELQEVRVDDNGCEINDMSITQHDDERKRKPTKLMLKEKRTENSGRKILSIRPARYEKVEDWHTPS